MCPTSVCSRGAHSSPCAHTCPQPQPSPSNVVFLSRPPPPRAAPTVCCPHCVPSRRVPPCRVLSRPAVLASLGGEGKARSRPWASGWGSPDGCQGRKLIARSGRTFTEPAAEEGGWVSETGAMQAPLANTRRPQAGPHVHTPGGGRCRWRDPAPGVRQPSLVAQPRARGMPSVSHVALSGCSLGGGRAETGRCAGQASDRALDGQPTAIPSEHS